MSFLQGKQLSARLRYRKGLHRPGQALDRRANLRRIGRNRRLARDFLITSPEPRAPRLSRHDQVRV